MRTDAPRAVSEVAIDERRVDQVYRLISPSLLLSAVVTVPLTILLHREVALRKLLVWSVVVCAVSGARYWGVRRYFADPLRASRARSWGRWFTAGAATSALGWSALGTVLFPAEGTWERPVLAFVVCGITAIGLVNIVVLAPAFRAFLGALLGPIVVFHASLGTSEGYGIAVSAAALGLTMLVISRTATASATVAIRAHVESEALAERLGEAMTETRANYEALQVEMSKRERAQALAHQADARLRLAIESAGVTTWEYVFSRRELTITGGAGEGSGAHASFLSRVHPEDRDTLRAESERLQAEGAGAMFRQEIRYEHEGRWRWLSALGRVMESAEPLRMMGVSLDITRRKAIQAELLAAKESAEAASLAKSQFLANMSHEIRTPLNGVVGMIELIAESPLAPAQRQMTQAASRSCEALLSVINNVLDLSKIEANRLELESAPFDPASVVDDVRALLGDVARRKGLVFACNTRAQPPRAIGDVTRVRQIVLNLASNAVKFTDRGEVSLDLFFAAGEGSRTSLTFVVRDSGIGLSPAQVERLFQPFSQADMSTSRRYGGSGLGLAISRQLADLMGGSIAVSSAPGAGSTFTFTLSLPRATDMGPAGRATSVADTSSGVESPLTPQTVRAMTLTTKRPLILVVEDHPINQQVARAMLQKLGCDVEVAAGGAEGAARALAVAFDMVFMDCQMPGVDGFEATRRIRSGEGVGKRVTIVALTANALQGDRERCLAAGMDDYLSKPFTTAALRDVLSRWIVEETADHGGAGPDGVGSDAIDQKALSDVRQLDPDGTLLSEIVGIFFTDGARLVDDVRAAQAVGNAAAIAFAAHTLKSCSGAVGARAVVERCSAIEGLARQQETVCSRQDVDALESCYRGACEVLARLTGVAAPPSGAAR